MSIWVKKFIVSPADHGLEKVHLQVYEIGCLDRKHDFSEICVLAWWLANRFLRIAPWILIRLTSNKNWRKLNWIENFVLRRKLKKTELTIWPSQKLDLPSYHGIFRGCRSELKSIVHTIFSLPWKFELHIYHSFREK